MRIKILSPNVINQIAAGEVIERPASVVKELLENSLDANAKIISVEIAKAGRSLIRIRDNGSGIHQDDLPLSIASHATSKMNQLADLQEIQSLGFRGEALASIASISRFRIASKITSAEMGWSLITDGDQSSYELQPTAHPVGTTIEVRDLFFNTPVRRKFLRSDSVETNHIEMVLKRLVLSRFDIAFDFKIDDKVIWQIAESIDEKTREKRIAKILSGSFLSHAKTIDYRVTDYRLWGWIGSPDFARNQNDSQYLYINGRMVKDKLLMHAIRLAYEDLLPPGRQPAYILYLELDPQSFDVNVHPAKQEVRFHEPRMVHNFIQSALKQALNQFLMPVATEAQSGSQNFALELLNSQPSQKTFKNKANQYWDNSLRRLTKIAQERSSYGPSQTKKNQMIASQHGIDNVEINNRASPSDEDCITAHFFRIDERYIVTMHAMQGAIICDTFLALQHLYSQRLLSELENGGINTRSLAVFLTVRLEENKKAKVEIDDLLKYYHKDFLLLGIELEELSPNTLVVRQFPKELNHINPKEVIVNIIRFMQKHYPQTISHENYTDLVRMMTEVSMPLKLSDVEISQLIKEIANSDNGISVVTKGPFFVSLSSALLQKILS